MNDVIKIRLGTNEGADLYIVSAFSGYSDFAFEMIDALSTLGIAREVKRHDASMCSHEINVAMYYHTTKVPRSRSTAKF